MEEKILKKLEQHDEYFKEQGVALKRHDEYFKRQDETLKRHDEYFKRQDEKLERLMLAVVDLQEDIKDMKPRLAHVEDVADKTFGKIDGFVVIVHRDEAEIAALRMSQERLTGRVTKLEARLAV